MNKNHVNDASSQAFQSGGSILGAMIRTQDWSTSPLRHPDTWPQSLRRVVDLLLNSKFPMFVAWGPDLGFLYNDAYAKLMGAKHPAALGKRFFDIWPEIWSAISPQIDRALQGEATYSDRVPLTIRRHGYDEQTWFTYSYSPVRDESGKVAGMYCVAVEVTEQVLSERYRSEENERLRALFEQAPGFMVLLRGPEYVFELANRAYLQLVGHRAIPFLGKPLREALPEVVGQDFIALLDQVYTTGQPFVGQGMPVMLQREPDGPLEKRFIDFVYQPIRDTHGMITGIFAEGSDVTERKLAEDGLRRLATDLSQANQRQSEFLATLAHELRNPLAPIRTGLDLMRLSASNPEALDKLRATMGRQVDHLVHLVDDLLDLARINTAKIEIRKTRVSLTELVPHAAETVLPAAQEKGHALGTHVPDEPLWVDADAHRLTQVIDNVLTNAIEYKPQRGRIDLALRQHGDHADITVTDNGIGIAAESLPTVFEMFTQGRHGAAHAAEGLGIGLSLVKRLTELHGGTVTAQSAGPNQGSTFIIRLPLARHGTQESTHNQMHELADLAPGTSRPLRILVADDNQDAAEMLRLLLETGGHRVRTVGDGQAALDVARQFQPDLALLDIGMPGLTGLEVAKALRRVPELRSMRLVALTGWGAPEDRARSRDAGFDDHLTKPVQSGTLGRLIAELQPPSQ